MSTELTTKQNELADENGRVRFGPDDYALTPDERVACYHVEVTSVVIRGRGTASFPREISNFDVTTQSYRLEGEKC